MTPYQKDIVIGTILGGSSLVRPRKGVNYYLAMADRDVVWLRYKMAELADYFPNTSIAADGGTSRCASRCCDELTGLYDELYREGRRAVRAETLCLLHDIGLAVWYLDGGGKTGRGRRNAYLNLTRLVDSAETIRDYFCEMDMTCTLGRSGSRLRLLFSVGGTERLFRIIVPKFPSYMCYRM